MNQEELTRAIAGKFFLTQVESRKIIKFILEEIARELQEGERVYFRGFGSFTRAMRSPKETRHPETGKIITIPAKLTVEFTPSKALLKKLT